MVESSNYRNSPERCLRPLYSTQEGHSYTQHCQGEDVMEIKVEVKTEEEETYVRDDEQSMEEDGIMRTYIEEDTPTEISTVHEQDMRRSSMDCLALSAECKVEDEDMRRRSEDCLTLSADYRVEDEDMRRRSEDCFALSADYRVEDEDMRRRSEDCVTLSADYRVEDEDMRRRSEDCVTLSADYRVEDDDMRRRSEDCVTLSADYRVEDDDMRRRSEDCLALSADYRVEDDDMRRRSEDCVTLSADYRVEDDDMRRRSEDCVTLSADYRVEDEDMRRRSEDCLTLYADYRVEDDDMRRRSEDCLTLSADCRVDVEDITPYSAGETTNVHLVPYNEDGPSYSFCLEELQTLREMDNLRPKRKRRSYEAGFKMTVVSRAEETNNSTASREFCVDEKQVREWRKMKADLQQIPKAKRARRGLKTSYGALEIELHKWIMESLQNGYCITRMGIRLRALQMATEDKYKVPGIEKFLASAGWCIRFMNRFGLYL
ncbi:uncharacterized protein ACMZJ9_022331 [Mantella aurantiaca]